MDAVLRRVVILADDDPDQRELIGCALRDAGFEVREACDGDELRACLTLAVVDLVITDESMPKANGLDVVACFPRRSEVPVILITGNCDVATRRRASDLGVAAVFAKPFDLADLREAALRLLAS